MEIEQRYINIFAAYSTNTYHDKHKFRKLIKWLLGN